MLSEPARPERILSLMTPEHPTVRKPPGPAPTSGRDAGCVARLALVTDALELVRLRAVMFESLGIDTTHPDWKAACRAHLEARLEDGNLVGAVVDQPRGPGLVASALAELSTRIPGPSRPTGSSAYLSSVSTDPAWRRRGMARAAVFLLLDELRRRGVRRVELHATPDGEPLYRSFGFLPRGGGRELRLVW